MNEKLAEKEKVFTSQSQLGARSVALCEGCPMIKFCATKDAGKCPEPNEISTESQTPTISYKRQLMDDSIDTVFANLQKKTEPPKPKNIIKKTPALIKKLPEKKSSESMAEKITDSILTALGVLALKK